MAATSDKKTSNFMLSTTEHDVLLCREVMAAELYKLKKGSNEMGRLWTGIAQSLNSSIEVEFKKNLSQRAVRERFSLLQTRFKEKEKEELRASGISTEQDELDVLLEEIAEREKAFKESKENANEKREKADKATAEEIRKQALERMGQTKKRKSQEEEDGGTKEKRKRRSGSDAVEFHKAKCEKEIVLREKEIEINKKEQQEKAGQFEVMFKQQQAMLQAVQQQQAQQQQQSQNMQLMMAQQNKALMSLVEKVLSKN